MSIQKISYGKNIILKGIKLKIDFSEKRMFEKFSSEANYSFNELLGYGICRVYNKKKEKIITILETRKNRYFV